MARAGGASAWGTGAAVNISRSGVLFELEEEIEPKTMLEMRILFPAEITGGIPVNVVCWGPVILIDRSGPGPALAAAILKYHFTREWV